MPFGNPSAAMTQRSALATALRLYQSSTNKSAAAGGKATLGRKDAAKAALEKP
jgi:hypothetical protein